MTAVYVAVLAPFAAAVLGLGAGRAAPRLVVPVALAGAGAAFLASLWAAARSAAEAPLRDTTLLATFPTGAFDVHVDLVLDGLAGTVSLAVGAVALAVQVYSTAYLKGDPRYSSYAAFVSLFTAAMMLVVFSGDLFVLLVGWEVMGVCSYFLIGHHWEQEVARAGAVKAFVVTRLGDVGFLFGIFVLAGAAGSSRIEDVLAATPGLDATQVTLATLLLLAGVAGKSAQFPLHTWLPDAMAGPTPISALIHAATMVAAGIYLVARLYPLFLAAPATLAVMAVMAALTMLGGALAALGQDDIKRVLAYSTVSQLAYMLGALAVGSATAATFHLLTHAAFKALLFLAAGSVIHAVGTNLMPAMGGLRRRMPLTFVTMTAGLAALAGLPPFSGFFSKEAVLSAAEKAALEEGPLAGWAAWLVLVAAVLTVAVTGAYVTRLWLMTFFDQPRSGVAAHEPSAAMRWPLLLLALPAVGLGLLGHSSMLPAWLGLHEELHLGVPTAALSVGAALAGVAAVWASWRADRSSDPFRLRGVRPALQNAFWVDGLYDRALVRPVRTAARGVRWTDDTAVVGTVTRTGDGAVGLGRLVALTQRGNVQTYLTGVLAGVLLLVLGVVTLT